LKGREIKMSDYLVITDSHKIDELMEVYFYAIGEKNFFKALRNFSNKEGFGVEYTRILFQDDLDDDEEEYEVLANRKVVVIIEYPIEKQDTEIFLTFEEFYIYLEKQGKKTIKEHSELESIKEMLREVKQTLEIVS